MVLFATSVTAEPAQKLNFVENRNVELCHIFVIKVRFHTKIPPSGPMCYEISKSGSIEKKKATTLGPDGQYPHQSI